MNNENPIFSKIRKLLALSKNNTSEHEAQAAAIKVQELLQANGLELAQIEASGGNTGDFGVREKMTSDRRALYLWQQSLMAALADNFFCMHYLSVVRAEDRSGKMRNSKRHCLVGRSINVASTLAMYDYLSNAIRRHADEQGFGHAERETDHHLFLDGAVSRLVERLQDARRQREVEAAESEAKRRAQGGNGNALVLSDVYGSEIDLNNDTLNGFPPGTTAARRREREEQAAARSARESELVAGGMDPVKAFYVSHGFGEEDAIRYAAAYVKSQSRPSRRSSGRNYTHGWTRGDDKHARKVASPAYKAGRITGGNVSLDAQVGNSPKKVIK